METRAEPVDLSPCQAPTRRPLWSSRRPTTPLRARVESLTESNRRMEHLISELRRFIYGRKSEKLGVDERQLAFEDLEGAVGEVQAATEPSAPPSPPTGKRRARRNIGQLPEHLERIERVIEPDSTECPCGCGQMVRIGEDRSRAAGHCAGDASRHRHRAPEVCLPDLRAGCRPGGRAGAPHRGWAADRGDAGAGAHFQVRGPFAALTVNRSSTPAQAWTCTAPRSPAGWARRRFI